MREQLLFVFAKKVSFAFGFSVKEKLFHKTVKGLQTLVQNRKYFIILFSLELQQF
jgi:hypothetical protein